MSKKKEEKIVDERFPEDGKVITEDIIKQEMNPLNPSEIPQHSPYEIRDTYYSQLLNNYNEEYKNRREQIKTMRNWMFWTMLSILVAVVVTSIVLFFIIVIKGVNSVEDIVSLVTVGISFISTILTIPIIIAKSLFPEKEDNQIVEVLTKLIENDQNIRQTSHNLDK